MGRSRGGLTSKIHALVDAEGCPVNLRLTGGQVADCTQADALMVDLGEGDILLADKGYDTDAIRAKAAARKAWANIPPKANRKGKPQRLLRVLALGLSCPENYLATIKLVAARIWCQSL